MFARSFRTETRSRAKEDIKRVATAVDKVRRWEKKWICLADSSMKIYKWVPMAAKKDVPQPAEGTSTSSSTTTTPIENNNSPQKENVPLKSIPKHMLPYIQDESSRESLDDSTADSFNDELSRDSTDTPVSQSAISLALNNEDSTLMSFPDGQRLEEGMIAPSGDTSEASSTQGFAEESNEPPAKKSKQDPPSGS